MPPDPAERARRQLLEERARLEAELNDLAAKVDLWQDRVEALKAFEAEYRARLDAYLDGLLATLRMEGRL